YPRWWPYHYEQPAPFGSCVVEQRAASAIVTALHSRRQSATQLVLDVRADDLVKRALRAEAERLRARSVDLAWPALDHRLDRRIRLTADELDSVLTGGASQGGNLVCNGCRKAGHVQGAL